MYNKDENTDLLLFDKLFKKRFEIPPKPSVFLHRPDLPFPIDEWKNSLDPMPPDGQRIFKNNTTRYCWNCQRFDIK